MALEIAFELDEDDVAYFRTLFENARQKAGRQNPQQTLKKARILLQNSLARKQPEFVRQRLAGLTKAITMAEDAAWRLPTDERDRLIAALAYFVAPDDLIADKTPVIGLLDDAIAAEIILRSLQHELDAYDEFSDFRAAEAQRRANAGKSTDISKEDWLADRRAVLHSRMRDRRLGDAAGWHTITLWGSD